MSVKDQVLLARSQKKKPSRKLRRKMKKLGKKIRKVSKKICKVQKKLGQKCKKSKNKRRGLKKFKKFQGKKVSHKQQAKLEKKLAKKRKQLAKWEGRRNNLLKEIGKAPPTPRQNRRLGKHNKHIARLQKEISEILRLLGKREKSLLSNKDPAFQANAEREKAAAVLANKISSPAGKQALTDFNQAADRLHQQQEDELARVKQAQEIKAKAIVDRQRADQKLAEAKKLEETAFNDRSKEIVADLKAQAKALAAQAKAREQQAALGGEDPVKKAENEAKRVEQQIADKTAIAKTLETLRTSVTPAGRETLQKLQQAQEQAAKAIKDQIRLASVAPVRVPPPTDADRIKDDPNGPFKRNDRNGVTAHEALVRIAKMQEQNKLADFSTSQMDKLLGTVADEKIDLRTSRSQY